MTSTHCKAATWISFSLGQSLSPWRAAWRLPFALPLTHLHFPLGPFLNRSSLSRDHRSALEKEQALRLTRLLLSLPGSGVEGDEHRAIPCSVIRAVVAIAESVDEKMRIMCLETLGELRKYLPPLSKSRPRPSPSVRLASVTLVYLPIDAYSGL